MKRSPVMMLAALIIVCSPIPATPDKATTPEQAAGRPEQPTLYVVGTAHLDTQWLWTIQETIANYVPSTLRDNFALFEKHPHYVFSFEGAFRYMLAKEYFPEEYARLKPYVAAGRWRVAGSAVDAGDTNLPSPEGLIRHVLYGNGFFKREFGKTSADIYLPDCFGFSAVLPTVATHCGLKGFSTQKLTWGSSVGIPFDVGVWEGIDGSGVVAALNPGNYVGKIREDLSRSAPWIKSARALGKRGAPRVAYHYFGTGDVGGAPDAESVDWLEKSLASNGPLHVVSTGSDQMARDLTAAEIARLPRYRGEFLMTTHGTGAYTSQAAMKRANRRNEQLAAAAEAASVAADWLSGAAYPHAKLSEAWIRVLWHHHHDDITGTSTPLAYPFSWNDEAISENAFASVLADASGAVTRGLDTRGEGIALVVFNALAIEREDVVEATIRFGQGAPESVGVRGGAGGPGAVVPSQVLARNGNDVRIAFLARVPAVGYAVFDVTAVPQSAPQPTPMPATEPGALRIDDGSLENRRYRVRVGASGDVTSIYDKTAQREVLAAPVRLEMRDDHSSVWPEWEILRDDLIGPPRETVGEPAVIRVLEHGPARIALEVTRRAGGSTIAQTISLAGGGAQEVVTIASRIDWKTRATLLKAAFPFASRNAKATYDLGLGAIERGNNRKALYEVPAQQWADLTQEDGAYGAAVLTDAKYGWDKPDDGTLRLSLVHSPARIEKDDGPHRFAYAIAGHAGDWRTGEVVDLAARLNQPLVAFVAPHHSGPLGRTFSMMEIEGRGVSVGALKKAEASDEIIVRLFERHGGSLQDGRVRMAAPILAAREVTGAEEPLDQDTGDNPQAGSGSRGTDAPAGRDFHLDQGSLVFSMAPHRPRTFALKLAAPAQPRPSAPIGTPVPLAFDTDVVSVAEDRSDGDFDGTGHTLPGELLPDAIVSEGIRFVLGPKEPAARNALTCRGQTLELPAAPRASRLYVLAAAVGGSVRDTFRIDGVDQPMTVPEFTGYRGQSQSLVIDGAIVATSHMEEPFNDATPIAWTGTHRHSRTGGDEPYVFCYLYKLRLDLPPATDGATRRLKLPDAPAIKVLAMTLVEGPNDDTVPASDLVDRVRAVRVRPKGGLFIGPAEVTLAIDDPALTIRYTMDGSVPTEASPAYGGPITVARPTMVTARAFFGDRGEEIVTSRQFRFATPKPAVAPGPVAPGLSFAAFEGEWRSLAEMKAKSLVKRGVAATVGATDRTREVNFGLEFTGFIDVPRDGVYAFHTRSDDGSTLSIDGEMVVDNDGLHGAILRSGEAALAAGKHALSIRFFQRGGDIDLAAFWDGPGIPRQELPASALSHTEAGLPDNRSQR